MIYVIATIQVAPGTRSAFLAEFAKVMPLVHAEAGCIEYGPTIDAETDIATQHRIGPDTVTIIEKWESVDTLRAHGMSAHMLAYRERVKDYTRGREIRILKHP
ncbi:MAG: putative quinol monooxygenase [Betaproteobacteria bacterium]